MAGREVHIPMGGPPRVERPSPEIYAAMGEDAIFRMLEDFYRRLGDSEIRWMFPKDMVEASKKSGAFFVGLLGGPPLYQQRHGSPMLRARHMPFPIDEDARQVWLATFRETLADAPEKYGFPPEHLPGFDAFLDAFSGWMVNTASPASDTRDQQGR
jgi:hemoglobin